MKRRASSDDFMAATEPVMPRIIVGRVDDLRKVSLSLTDKGYYSINLQLIKTQ